MIYGKNSYASTSYSNPGVYSIVNQSILTGTLLFTSTIYKTIRKILSYSLLNITGTINRLLTLYRILLAQLTFIISFATSLSRRAHVFLLYARERFIRLFNVTRKF